MNYSLGKRKRDAKDDKYCSINNNNITGCKLSTTATSSSTDKTNNNNTNGNANYDDGELREPPERQQIVEISAPNTMPTTTSPSSRLANQKEHEQEPQEQQQHYNRINNNHVIAGVVVGPESPSGTTTKCAPVVATVAADAAGDECDAAKPVASSCCSEEVPTPVTPGNGDGNESPSKADVDTRIPVYV